MEYARQQEVLKKNNTEILHELMFYYRMKYSLDDRKARRSIGRDLRRYMDVEDTVRRRDLVIAKKEGRIIN